MNSAPVVLGIDGARGGWLVAEFVSGSRELSTAFVERLEPVVERLDDDVATIAIDMPIGLPANGKRPSDQLARDRLGPRRSTFFPTPIRAVLDSSDYTEANETSKARAGAGLSKQAWNLVPKIREVNALWQPPLNGRLIEAHPELSFAEIAGAPVLSKKATPEGREERVGLLREVFDETVSAAVEALSSKLRVDAIDACVLAWTAERARSGEVVVLGDGFDESGRPMTVSI